MLPSSISHRTWEDWTVHVSNEHSPLYIHTVHNGIAWKNPAKSWDLSYISTETYYKQYSKNPGEVAILKIDWEIIGGRLYNIVQLNTNATILDLHTIFSIDAVPAVHSTRMKRESLKITSDSTETCARNDSVEVVDHQNIFLEKQNVRNYYSQYRQIS